MMREALGKTHEKTAQRRSKKAYNEPGTSYASDNDEIQTDFDYYNEVHTSNKDDAANEVYFAQEKGILTPSNDSSESSQSEEKSDASNGDSDQKEGFEEGTLCILDEEMQDEQLEIENDDEDGLLDLILGDLSLYNGSTISVDKAVFLLGEYCIESKQSKIDLERVLKIINKILPNGHHLSNTYFKFTTYNL